MKKTITIRTLIATVALTGGLALGQSYFNETKSQESVPTSSYWLQGCRLPGGSSGYECVTCENANCGLSASCG